MFSSNSARVLCVSLIVFLLFSSCRYWQKEGSEQPAPPISAAEELKSNIPFSNKEPENFQAEFVIMVNGKASKTFMARSGGNSRLEYDFGEKNQFAIIKTADNKIFQLITAKKIYAENLPDATILNAENPFDFLTNELLNQKTDAKFEKLGAENGLMKYRAVFGDSGNSEVVTWIDEKINLPVKQEFYSVSGEQKILTFTFEMKNFKPQTENSLFEIPKDFRKVTIEEFRKILKSEN